MENRKILKINIFLFFLILIFLANSKFTFAIECSYCCPPACPGGLVPGGLVPCGRHCDDPDTAIVEAAPCTLCHFFILLKRIIDFALFRIVFPLAVLMIVIGGAMFMIGMFGGAEVLPGGAKGGPTLINRARKLMTSVVMGLLIIFAAWLIINTSIYFLTKGMAGGVATILGKPWNKIECPVLEIGAFTCCGDGKVQRPQAGPPPYTFYEECEKNEPFADFLARGTDDLDKDGDVDNVDYGIMQFTCTDQCTLACKDDPLFTEIDKGCYLPGVECQKGKYVCDTDTNTVVCRDVYPSPIYDYCCRAAEDPNYDLDDAQRDINAIEWERVKPRAAEIGTGAAEKEKPGSGTFECDEVCRERGKICIGTAITDDVSTACYGVKCHSGNDCTLDANMARIDCRLEFPFTRKDVSSAHRCTNPETYYVGYTSCLCK